MVDEKSVIHPTDDTLVGWKTTKRFPPITTKIRIKPTVTGAAYRHL